VIAETIALVSAANAAISQVKQLAAHGKDIASMGRQLSTIMEAEETLKAQGETKKKSLFRKAMGKSADDMQEFLELEKLKEARKEIESHFRLYGRPGLWNDWIKYEAEARVRKKQEAEERERARAAIISGLQWTLAVIFFVGVLIWLLYFASNNRGVLSWL